MPVVLAIIFGVFVSMVAPLEPIAPEPLMKAAEVEPVTVPAV